MGANKALEMLGKHLAMFTVKTDNKTESVISGKVVVVKQNPSGVPLANRETDVSTS